VSKILKEWNTKGVLAMVSGNLVSNMDRACDFCMEQARGRAKRRTGKMAKAISKEVRVIGAEDVIEGRIGIPTGKGAPFYAYFIEVGTSKMAAAPFLRPAVFGNGATILRILQGLQ